MPCATRLLLLLRCSILVYDSGMSQKSFFQKVTDFFASFAETESQARERFLSEATSIAHLEALEREWDRRQAASVFGSTRRHPQLGRYNGA